MEFISMRLCFFRQRFIIKKLKETDKAKPLYEKIIFNHEDSICGSEKNFRQLRGDINLKRLTV
jgi:uncharacterized pyridoxamine 5'-phosphate oxidase family protein